MTRRRTFYLFVLLLVVGLDQVTKTIVDRLLTLHQSRTLVGGLASLTYVQNRGAAFGLLSDANLPYQAVLFSAVSLAALGAIAVYALSLPPQSRLSQTALALIMGGAVGNLLDRARLGYVIDFVDVHWRSHHWPAFNVADSSISIGVALLILDILRSPREGHLKTEIAEAASPGRTD